MESRPIILYSVPELVELVYRECAKAAALPWSPFMNPLDPSLTDVSNHDLSFSAPDFYSKAPTMYLYTPLEHRSTNSSNNRARRLPDACGGQEIT